MSDLTTEEELARARSDPAFRQQLLARNLDQLLDALKRMRQGDDQNEDTARQIREGVDLAITLADRLRGNNLESHADGYTNEPTPAIGRGVHVRR